MMKTFEELGAANDNGTVKIRVTFDLETSGDTDAEELGYLLNMLRFEMRHWPKWRSKLQPVRVLPK
jgi:hypothetical protein